MYFLKKLVWLYDVQPWLISKGKGWQFNWKVVKDTVVNVQKLWNGLFPCNDIRYTNENMVFWVLVVLVLHTHLRYSKHSDSQVPQSLGNGPSVMCCWSPNVWHSIALSFSSSSMSALPVRPSLMQPRSATSQHPSGQGGPKGRGKSSSAYAKVAPWGVLAFAGHHCRYALWPSFIWSGGKRLPCLLPLCTCPGEKTSLSPAFAVQNHQWEFASSTACRQLWQLSFTHEGVLRSPRRNTVVAEEPALKGNNGNGHKKLPINVSLELKSGILLAALCGASPWPSWN